MIASTTRNQCGAASVIVITTFTCLFVAMPGCNRPEKERAGAATASSETADSSEEATVEVRVSRVERRAMTQTIESLGRCEALPGKQAVISPAIEGQVRKLLVAEGQRVTAGQPLVELDPALTQFDLKEKQAARDELAAALKLLQSLPRQQERKAEELAIEQARIGVERAQSLVESLRPLRDHNEVSQQQMHEAEQALAQAKVQQQTAEAKLKMLMLGPRAEAVAEAEAKIQAAEDAIATVQARLDLHTLRAPIAGVLDELNCRPGQTLAVGTEIGSVVDDAQIQAIAWLPVTSASQVVISQDAEVRAAKRQNASQHPELQQTSQRPNIASPKGEPSNGIASALPGKVVFVGRVADPQTGSVPVHILADNARNSLVIGQTVEVVVRTRQSDAVIAVPQSAIHDEGDGPSLTVVRQGKAVVLQPTTGECSEGWVAISGIDLKEGEPVVVEGGYNLPDGTPVKTAPIKAEPGKSAPVESAPVKSVPAQSAPLKQGK